MNPQVKNSAEASFVRISTEDKVVVGAGFLVSDEGHVLTCAHVVFQALDILGDASEKPEGTVHLDFPFVDSSGCTAQVEEWQPRAGSDEEPSGDIALLRLVEPLPDGARPARLITGRQLSGRPFKAYGYPQGYDAGVWAYGEIRDRLKNGWLQVEGTTETGKRIEPGFSGGPVVDQETDFVSGMVVASTEDRLDKVGFVIPIEILNGVSPDLELLAKTHRKVGRNTAPPMPNNFVPRPEVLNELRHAVINVERERAGTPIALRGMGGIGKTALASALSYDETIQAAFADGIVWLEIGREPGDLTGQMQQIGQFLDDEVGKRLGYYESPEAGANRLKLLLAEKAVLVILDDVWEARHVEPFVSNAARVRILFTTRSAHVALDLEAVDVPLGVLAPQQATELLRGWTRRDDPTLTSIAARLGYLPLALRLAGSRLREGMSGEAWLERFHHVSQIKLGRRSNDRKDSLQVCFDLSVHELLLEDRQLYYHLAIFPEDLRIPQSAIVHLWQQLYPTLDQLACEELLTDLARLALVERDPSEQTVWLHDLLRDYTSEQLAADWVASHNALLDAYNPDMKPWDQVEPDVYLYRNLVYHLRQAGRRDELYSLLTGSPQWMTIKSNEYPDAGSYEADLDGTIANFSNPLSAPDLLVLVGLHTARHVVNVESGSFNDADLQTLVWLGRQSEALAYARLRNSAEDRFHALMRIYNVIQERDHAEPSLLAEAREIVPTIKDDDRRADALVVMARAMATAEGYEAAREIVSSIPDDHKRVNALVAMAAVMAQGRDEHRADTLFYEARKVARSIKDDEAQAQARATIVEAMATSGRYEEAKETMASIEGGSRRAQALVAVAGAMATAGLYEEAQSVARAIRTYDQQAQALVAVAAAMATAGRYKEALRLTRTIQHGREWALTPLVSALAKVAHYEEANEVIQSMQHGREQEQALAAVASAMASAGRYDEAQALTRSIRNTEVWTQALRDVAEAMAREGDKSRANTLFQKAQEVARSVELNRELINALMAVANAMASAGHYDEAQALAGSIPDTEAQAQTLVSLVRTMATAGHYEEANEVIQSMQHGREQEQALAAMASAMASAGRYDEAQVAASSIRDNWRQVTALRDVARVMAKAGHYKEAREVLPTRFINDEEAQDAVLATVSESMATTGHSDGAWEVARSIRSAEVRAQALKSLAGAMATAGRYEAAEKVALSIPFQRERMEGLVALARALATAGHYKEARAIAGPIELNRERVDALVAVVEAMATAGYYEDAQEEIMPSILHHGQRARALVAAAKAMARKGDERQAKLLFREAQELAGAISSYEQRMEALISMAGAMASVEHFQEAQELAHTLSDSRARTQALRGVVAPLTQSGRFDKALAVLVPCTLDEFLLTLAEWGPLLEQTATGLSIEVLREATRIAGWVRSDWHKIHLLLSPSDLSA